MSQPREMAGVGRGTETSGRKAKAGKTRPGRGTPGTRMGGGSEYRRHGTAVLFAGLDVHEGTVAGWVTDSTRSDNFVDFLADLVARHRPGWTCTASSTTSRPTRPTRSPGSSPSTVTPTCTSRRRTP